MSASYYPITGYGIEISSIERFIDEKKLVDFLKEKGIYEEGCNDIDSYVSGRGGEAFWSVADMFVAADDTNILDCERADCGDYLYLPSLLPWESNELYKALTVKDVKEIIVKCVSKLTNLSPEQISERTGYVFDAYYG